MNCIQEYLAMCPEELLYQAYLEEIYYKNTDSEYQNYLEKCIKGAKLYKKRRVQYKDHLRTEYVGTVKRGKWLVDIYEDSEGSFWTDDRVMIGKWIVTGYELVSGQKEKNNTFQKHTGKESDWEKVCKKYGGVPPYWESIPEEREDGCEDYSGNVA